MRRVLLSALILCGSAALRSQSPDPYRWDLPKGVAEPRVPADNPMSEAKVQLGRYLFYDERLSGNGTQSCASCHQQAKAFTDGRAQGLGSTGQLHPRGSMSLANIAFAATLTWSDPAMTVLENQARVPMFGEHPIELGLTTTGPWLNAVRADAAYTPLFKDAFDIAPSAVTADHVVKAIASFERSIISLRSAYDRYHDQHDYSQVSDAARRGEVVFHSRPHSCFTCHGGFLFTNDAAFANTAAPGRRPDGEMKAPTLRNIAVTAPYLHDGSAAALEEAVDHRKTGLTPAQRADLVEFMKSLTDHALLTDPRFSDPWPRTRAPK